MGLIYSYSFSAAPSILAEELEVFLKTVEVKVKKMGFSPTIVINTKFDNHERQEFVRPLRTGLKLEHEKLKGVVLLAEGQVWDHDPENGVCRVMPTQGVLLIVSNEKKEDTAFGFFRYPEALKDMNGREVVKTGGGKRWLFQDSVNTADPRYRQIVKLFVDVGYCDAEFDEFAERSKT